MRAPGLLADPSRARTSSSLSWTASSSTPGAAACARRRRVRRLWEERNWPLEALDRLAEAQERGPHALLDRAGRELERLFSSPRRRQARLLEASELDEARALAAGRAALAELRELATSDRALAPGSASELARVLERVEIYSGAGAARLQRPTRSPCSIRSRCGRGACGRCSSAAFRRACSRRARAPSRCSRRRSAGAWRRSRDCGSARARTRSPPSATCCTRPCRARRSGSRSAGTSPTTTAKPSPGRCSWTTSATSSTSGSRTAARAARSARVDGARAGEAVPGGAAGRRAPRRAGACATSGVLAELRRARVVGVLARALDRLPGALVRRAACSLPTRSSRSPSRSRAGASRTPRCATCSTACARRRAARA